MTRSMASVVSLAAAAVSLVAALGPACGIDPRSGDFRCDPGCPSDRTCVDGWCVQRPDAAVDAPPTDGRGCPSQCDWCSATSCVINCAAAGSCAATVVCPDGWTCEVYCEGSNACAGGVRCDPGNACFIDCDGTGSCAGQIDCDTGRCDVTCGGTGSCAAGVECAASCRCETQCAASACGGGNDCPGPAQCEDNGECVAQAGVCRSC